MMISEWFSLTRVGAEKLGWHNKPDVTLSCFNFSSYPGASFYTHQVFDEMSERSSYPILTTNNHTKRWVCTQCG